jgi:hypothetical protein
MPVYGYDQPEQQAGYLSKDAFNRDTQAWELAESNHSLTDAFSPQYATDQYGGMLALSAGIYRGLSPDAHRAYLILILAAGAAAIGVAFAFGAIRERWDEKIANMAGWILVLYPESIFWGASQMREPFLITLIAIAFWAILAYPRWRIVAAIALAASLIGLFLISNVVALAAAGVLAVLAWLEYLPEGRPVWRRLLGWVLIGGGAVGMLLLTGFWLKSSANYDAVLTEQGSGQIQYLLEHLGKRFQIPVVTIYGITRPLLPAAIFETAAWLPKTLSIWRATGWYILIPFLVYGLFSVMLVQDRHLRRTTAWLILFSWIWILISSARAGGDTTDNPRYRVIFLLIMSLSVGWAYYRATSIKSNWLSRILIIEVIFLAVTSTWYLSRYVSIFSVFPITLVFGVTIAATIAIIGLGWWMDRTRGRMREEDEHRA